MSRAGHFEPWRSRRRRLVRRLDGGVALMAAAPRRVHSNDVEHRYRQDSDLLYLTGFPEPEAAALMAPGRRPGPFWLLVRPRTQAEEVWDGPRAGLEGARELHGADVARPIGELEDALAEVLDGAPSLHYFMGRDPATDALVARVLQRLRRARGRRPPPVIGDLAAIVHEMRLVKDRHEIARMRAAARITCAAHRAALSRVRPGLHEYEIQAELESVFLREGAAGPGYPSIVASGPNALVLHSSSNRRRMRPGELLLVDAGCEYQGYNADVTRTVPVSGRFSRTQRQVHDLVHAAQSAAIAAVRPGAAFTAPHRAAGRVLAQGLVDLGIIPPGAGAEQVRRYTVHSTSHWLGMDVHDVGDARPAGRPRRLRAGMVLTVEPGLYLPQDDDQVPAAYRGLGVRIEDDVLVTARGREVLSAGLPRSAGAIQRLVGRRR